MRELLNILRAGGSLALLRRPRLDGLDLTPGRFWLLAAVGLGISFGGSWIGVESPRVLVPDALQTEGFFIALTLLLGFLLAGILALPELIWRLPVLLASAGLWVSVLNRGVYDWLLPELAAEPEVYTVYFSLVWLWWALIIQRALAALAPARSARKRAALAVTATVCSAAPAYCLDYQEFWRIDYQARYARQLARGGSSGLAAEEILYRQPALLAKTLDQVAAGQPGNTELYFVAFGGYGSQDVFMKEVLYTQGLFRERLGAAGHTVALINNAKLVHTVPLASVTNLRATLQALARRMNPEEDILFLFLTSHGTQERGLTVELEQLPLQDLTAAGLAAMLQEAGIRWKVIVVSACYSGGFIEPLKDPHSLIITASRADRNSFGCSDSAEFTYFGRAFFTRALAETVSFSEAFAKAKALIKRWERDNGYTPSEPQIAGSALIEAQLGRWRATLADTPGLAGDDSMPGCIGQAC